MNIIFVLLLSFVNMNTECLEGETKFAQDKELGAISYYTFGILPASRESIVELKNCCDINVVSLGCAVSDYYTCYNAKVEKHVLVKNMVVISGVLNRDR